MSRLTLSIVQTMIALARDLKHPEVTFLADEWACLSPAEQASAQRLSKAWAMPIRII